MKVVIVVSILFLFLREIVRMAIAIKNDEKLIKILAPCFCACVIVVLANFVGDLLTTM